MREHWPKLVIVGLLAIVVGVPLALHRSGPQPGSGAARLVIVTPHNEQIRDEFSRAFNAYRASRGESAVVLDFRTSGGTSDLRKDVVSQFQAKADKGEEDQGIGVDLFFGGGEYEHNQLASGVTVTREGEKVNIPCTVPIKLPPGMLQEVFPNPMIGGERLYHPDLRWVGAALSSFGIVYNNDVLDMLGVPQPETWRDMGDPKLANWVALADPAHSGSIAATFETVLRRRGWGEGWHTLRRVFANARYFTASSSNVPVDVSAGNAAEGMCIDFYGRFQSQAIGNNRVGYVDPKHLTATTADPISILRGAPHRQLAHEFVTWLLSKPAQRLWQLKVAAPGGPTKFELRRQPIRADLYRASEKADWTDPQLDPFGQAKALPQAMPGFYSLVAPVSHAIGIDTHDELVAAWAVIRRTPENDPRRPAMLKAFNAMPPRLTVAWPSDAVAAHWHEAIRDPASEYHDAAAKALGDFVARLSQRYKNNPDQALRDRLAWTLFFQNHYRKVVAMER